MDFCKEKPLGFWCGRVALAFKAQVDALTRELGFTGADAIVVCILGAHGESSLAQLARIMEHAHPSVLRHLDSLEASGYIERCPHPSDRRVKLIRLTSKGEEILPVLREVMWRVQQRAVAGMSGEEVAQLCGLLQQVAENLGWEPDGLSSGLCAGKEPGRP